MTVTRTEGEVGGERGAERERRNEGEGETRTGSRAYRQKETKERDKRQGRSQSYYGEKREGCR